MARSRRYATHPTLAWIRGRRDAVFSLHFLMKDLMKPTIYLKAGLWHCVAPTPTHIPERPTDFYGRGPEKPPHGVGATPQDAYIRYIYQATHHHEGAPS